MTENICFPSPLVEARLKTKAAPFLCKRSARIRDTVRRLELSDLSFDSGSAMLRPEYFGIPPENLATQGHGERYLRIRTEFSKPRNRRVTFKRITPLVSPHVDYAG